MQRYVTMGFFCSLFPAPSEKSAFWKQFLARHWHRGWCDDRLLFVFLVNYNAMSALDLPVLQWAVFLACVNALQLFLNYSSSLVSSPQTALLSLIYCVQSFSETVYGAMGSLKTLCSSYLVNLQWRFYSQCFSLIVKNVFASLLSKCVAHVQDWAGLFAVKQPT